MKNLGCAIAAIATFIFIGWAVVEGAERPPWAYAVDPPSHQSGPPKAPEVVEQEALAALAKYMRPSDDGVAKHVPGSTISFTLTQIHDLFNPPDWHPEDHPSVPHSVARGRQPTVFACGYCHLPNGLGHPDNASLAGLPADYIVQQVLDIRSGARRSSAPTLLPQVLMLMTSKGVADDELKAAADYFSKLQLTPSIKVVETDTVPKTRFAGFMLVPAEPRSMEPIGQRIIEVSEDLTRTELRDPRSTFVAYVPPGSLKQGEWLVTTGGSGKTVQCGVCHGLDLRGLGPIPGIAGRSPSYIARQLYDLQHGTRAGSWSPLMANVVANLTEEDIVSVVAYLTSLPP